MRLTVEARVPTRQSLVAALTRKAGVCEGKGQVAEDELRLVFLETGAELWDHTTRRHGLSIGFDDIDLRTGPGNLSHRQPLAKAMGKRARHILDATGGFGHDAALLTCMGWDVTCVERHPCLAIILELAAAQVGKSPRLFKAMGDRLRVVHGDACQVLTKGTYPTPPDVVYMDPMFEPRHGSAKPRKRAQLLQRLVGTDQDAPALLAVARNVCRRVVVKRPNDGAPLAASPDVVFKGRQVRYDVYLQQAGMAMGGLG